MATHKAPVDVRIGFIGQGFIGGNMADDFEGRGYDIVRYALEEPYTSNKEAIAECDIVFIAVPTPTTPEGFSDKALRAVLPLVGAGKIAVIKSTILPGRTEELQAAFPHCKVLHSPEFLREKTAQEDTRKPPRNIVGIPKETAEYEAAGKLVLSVLPTAPYEKLMSARSAELVKYGGNCFLATKVVFMNMLYDLAISVGAQYEDIADAMAHDERIGGSHMKVVDNSGHKGAKHGRGAGGHCFPKDLAALREHVVETLGTSAHAAQVLRAIEEHNTTLLVESEKDLDLLGEIYSQSVLESLREKLPSGTKDEVGSPQC
jgi:UDPglucose 6-dehydrogenase